MKLHTSSGLRGTVTVPGDKSISHRAVMLGALADGDTHISGFLMGEDCLSTIDCFRKMGVQIDVWDGGVTVHGVGLHGLRAPEGPLYTGNSGTTTRLLSGILAAQPFPVSMTGDASIEQRPMGRIITPLREMGADIRGRDGKYCPLHIAPAALHGVRYEMPVASAQLKSAILLAGLYADGVTEVVEPAPSRDHTERMLRAMGADITCTNVRDAAEPVADLTVRASALHGTEIGGPLIPRLIDELPVLAAAAAFAEGETVIRDAQELKVKESNRIAAMVAELTRAGVDCTETADGMVIRGGRPRGAAFETYRDHRIAMSMAVLALGAAGESEILDPGVVSISYPGFFDTLRQIGG